MKSIDEIPLLGRLMMGLEVVNRSEWMKVDMMDLINSDMYDD